MNLHFKRIHFCMFFSCIIIITFLLNVSCSKDLDTLRASVISDDVTTIVEQDDEGNSTNNDPTVEEEQDNVPNEEENSLNEDPLNVQNCSTTGGKANELGLKTWCWGDVFVPSGESSGTESFSNGELALNIECNANQVVQEGDRLKFVLNPQNPSPASWCNNSFNMRAEIRTMPWKVNQPLGTEEWIGWSYTFSDDYKIDEENPWLFFQMQQGVAGSPPHELAIVPSSLYGAENGEVVVINHANKTETDRSRTGVVPTAGTTLNIVVHVIHDLGTKGLLQVWINNELVYDKQVGTVHESAPWGGNAKFGIYKWPWRESAGVQKSLDQGISHLVTYMGPLKIITRKPGDENYGQNSFSTVAPN